MSSSIDASAARLLGSSASFSHSRESHSHLSLSSGRVSFSAFRRQYSDCSRQAFASFIPNSPPSSKRQIPAKPPGDVPLGVGVKRHLVEFEYYFFWSPLTQTVRFYARHGDSRIRCAVTRTSLEDLAQSSGRLHPRDLERAFEEHRQTIERIAVDKILAGHFQGDGTVLIRTVDLNP